VAWGRKQRPVQDPSIHEVPINSKARQSLERDLHTSDYYRGDKLTLTIHDIATLDEETLRRLGDERREALEIEVGKRLPGVAVTVKRNGSGLKP
jgi:hypothetical protein